MHGSDELNHSILLINDDVLIVSGQQMCVLYIMNERYDHHSYKAIAILAPNRI